jgi:Holliday junction resolvase RusA-like endonuclease
MQRRIHTQETFWGTSNPMTPETRKRIQELQKRVLNPVGKSLLFKNDQQVLDAAVEHLYQDLKKKKVL